MTHSLHRSGDLESQKKDFNWFMYQTKGVNDKNIRDKALEFIATAEAWHSENWGDVKTGPLTQYTSEEIRKNISDKSRIRGVFTSKEQRAAALAPWIEYYNTERHHSALGGKPPISRVLPT